MVSKVIKELKLLKAAGPDNIQRAYPGIHNDGVNLLARKGSANDTDENDYIPNSYIAKIMSNKVQVRTTHSIKEHSGHKTW